MIGLTIVLCSCCMTVSLVMSSVLIAFCAFFDGIDRSIEQLQKRKKAALAASNQYSLYNHTQRHATALNMAV